MPFLSGISSGCANQVSGKALRTKYQEKLCVSGRVKSHVTYEAKTPSTFTSLKVFWKDETHKSKLQSKMHPETRHHYSSTVIPVTRSLTANGVPWPTANGRDWSVRLPVAKQTSPLPLSPSLNNGAPSSIFSSAWRFRGRS